LPASALPPALERIHPGEEEQVNTHFCPARGQLKLRERSLAPDHAAAELIAYVRPDTPGARRSDYQILAVPDPAALRALLAELLGVHVRVAKRREILLVDNVRIHLDRVEGLGDFLELEAVFDGTPETERREHAKVELLLEKLELAGEPRIATSYEALSSG